MHVLTVERSRVQCPLLEPFLALFLALSALFLGQRQGLMYSSANPQKHQTNCAQKFRTEFVKQNFHPAEYPPLRYPFGQSMAGWAHKRMRPRRRAWSCSNENGNANHRQRPVYPPSHGPWLHGTRALWGGVPDGDANNAEAGEDAPRLHRQTVNRRGALGGRAAPPERAPTYFDFRGISHSERQPRPGSQFEAGFIQRPATERVGLMGG